MDDPNPHLHFGEVSPRQLWHGLARMASKRGLPVEPWRGSQFLAEVGWREFAHHLLYHFPHTLGWPWTAGCGADAAPYFRVFNPMSQGERFDPRADYVRRWCPELAKLPNEWAHRPWQMPAEALARAGVELGRTYPEPVVSHRIAREIALEAFSHIKPS